MNKYDLYQILTEELEIEANDELVKIKFDGIQIPMIQRDYAQGRKNELEIRTRFLDAIFDALLSGTELQLDFVYGSVKAHENAKFFIPLDGQQRLTTLFLLNWYIGQREIDSADDLQQRQQQLMKFSYDTRPTARTFCEAICQMGRVDLFRLPSAVFKDAGWFYSAYAKDPTVNAMLLMLDDIHQLYNAKETKVFQQLHLLKFYILPLDGFGLTDELYIKMNARGKPLTDFENFKADLTKWMKDDKNPEKEQFHQLTTYKGRQMPYYLAFSLKLDNDWTEFFWSFSRNEKKEEAKIVDPLFLRFFHRYLLNSFIVSSKLKVDAIEKSDEFEMLYTHDRKDVQLKYTNFGLFEPHVGSFVVIDRITKVLDTITQNYPVIAAAIRPAWNASDNWRFFDPEISQTQRILFAAITGYAERHNFDEKTFREWMRVTWNIINNPDIRSIPAMITAMKLIVGLVVNASGLYQYLAEKSTVFRLTHNTNTELHEEYIKARLIVKDAAWETDLVAAESHELFQGSIGFLLIGDPDRGQFNHRLMLACALFGKNEPNKNYAKEYLLMRATIGKITKAFQLKSFKMEESERNWSLLLRRNDAVRHIISDFCNHPTTAEMDADILRSISATSTISWQEPESSVRKIRRVHEQLYIEKDFHAWMQERNAVDLQERDDHYYIKKYRAWYDLVMLDTYRNELISQLIDRFGLKTDARCGETAFFKGAAIKLEKPLSGSLLTAEFDQYSTLKIGLKKELNYFAEAPNLNGGSVEPGWHYVRYYNYVALTSLADVIQLADTVSREIFDVDLPDSLAAQLALINVMTE